MTNICFASTNYGPLWAPAVASWLRVVGYTSRHFEMAQIGRLGGVGITDRQYTMQAQNNLVSEMLANPEFTHLFMTECDMILPHDCIVKLVELDKDMASGIYFLRSDVPEQRGQPCLYKKSPIRPVGDPNMFYHSPVTLFPTNKPFRVDNAGLGCVLFKRKVFETVPSPWFDLKAGHDNGDGYGSDMYFFTHARQCGLELWVDPSVQCGQIDYYETNLADYKWQLENNPGFGGRGFIIGQVNGSTEP